MNSYLLNRCILTYHSDINRNFLFAGDWFKPFHRLVPGILEQIPILVYAGDADYICNWLGNQAWTNKLEWPGQKDFNKASIKDITLDNGDKYGKVGENLFKPFAVLGWRDILIHDFRSSTVET